MNENFIISKELARQFANDWYDVIVKDIKNSKNQNTNSGSVNQSRKKGKSK